MRKLALLAMLAFSTAAFGQLPPLTLPEISPAASVSQTIGITEITINYHRPAVNGRKIWGELEPLGEVWRAGANENTTISFSTPVTIEGQKLDAGIYGLHMIPTATTWTVIFNKESRAWGSYAYDAKQDALRITVTPQPADLQERLIYTFDNPDATSVVAALRWEKVRIPFKIEVDVTNTVLENVRHELTGRTRFGSDSWNAAAGWSLRNNGNLDEALAWADQAVTMQPSFRNLRTKAAIVEKKGDTAQATALRERAMSVATETDLTTYGRQLLGQKNVDEALSVFTKNATAHPQSSSAQAALASAYAAKGDKKSALTAYGKALTLATSDAEKQRINDEMKKLQ
jgi:tetratricopeptide (TPR) repeat protein